MPPIPCPFCGGNAELNAKYSKTTDTYFIFTMCEECHAQTRGIPSREHPEKNGWESEECKEAVELWNRRISL